MTGKISQGRKHRRERAQQRKQEERGPWRITPELSGNARQKISINEITLRSSIAEVTALEQSKKVHKDYLRKIDEIERDILQRTVFVSNVRNLRKKENMILLRSFFTDYFGSVEECSKVFSTSPAAASSAGTDSTSSDSSVMSGSTNSQSVYPSARVRFQFRSDAERIFKCELRLARKKYLPLKGMYKSLATHKSNTLMVQPTKKYPDMCNLNESFKFHISASSLALGHWYSDLEGKDMFSSFQEFSKFDDCNEHVDEWVEELQTNFIPVISFDMNQRTVELKMTINPAHKAYNTNDIYDIYHIKSKNMSLPTYSLSFRFKDLVQAMELRRDKSSVIGDQFSLIFTLKHPPKVYAKLVAYDGVVVKERLPSIFGGNAKPYHFGTCLGYKLALNKSSFDSLLFKTEVVEKLKLYGVFHDDIDEVEMMHTFVYRTNMTTKLEVIGDSKADLLLQSFVDRGRCCSYYMFQDRTIKSNQTIFEFCKAALETSAQSVHKILDQMANAHGRTKYPARLLETLLGMEMHSIKKKGRSDVSMPEYCYALPRLLITPTRVAVFGFETEMSNRVVRKFVSEEGFDPTLFCRVCIGDENGDNLYTVVDLSEQATDWFKPILLDGVRIAGRHYRFLAYSSSQLKEASIWMISVETKQWTVPKIREWMGEFNEDSPSKLAARMGQCFSTTFQAVHEDENGTHKELTVCDDYPDIEVEDNFRILCHSDGTGIICRDLLRELVKQLPFAPSNLLNAFIIQIRYGGAKGTLVGWDLKMLHAVVGSPDFLSYQVFLRPSMVKFVAPYRDVEIIKVGSHVPYYLNRHVILLLMVHGVKAETFFDMQRDMINDLDSILVDSGRAQSLLPLLGGADSGLVSTLMRMLIAGIKPNRDPFLFSCLHSIRAHHLTNLRKKSRIFIKDGAVLLGSIDETGLLPEGCVYIELSTTGRSMGDVYDGSKDEYLPMTGPVMVTKHPVMHPGDTRMLLAMDIPELHGHRNMILFSRNGVRPEADKMSGSDLDGDEFAVTWDSRLFLREWNEAEQDERGYWISANDGSMLPVYGDNIVLDAKNLQKANHPPMNFQESLGLPISCGSPPFNDEDLIDFFFDYQKNANLGWIASMWLDYAAMKGADCEDCLELAQLHSIAVDFPKSGVPAVMPPYLKTGCGYNRAHWREIKERKAYHDKGVIGVLYDDVIAEESVQDLSDFPFALAGRRVDRYGQILCFARNVSAHLADVYQEDLPKALEFNIAIEAWEQDFDRELLLFARDQMRKYNNDLMALMNKHKIHSESEVVTGLIRKYHKLNKRRRHAVSEEIRRSYRELRKNYRELFFDKVTELVWEERPNDGTINVEGSEESNSSGNDTSGDDSSSGDGLTTNAEISSEETQIYLMRAVVEKEALNREALPLDDTEEETVEDAIRYHARKLAAAYYMAVYCRHTDGDSSEESDKNENEEQALFSFAWIMADVIELGVSVASHRAACSAPSS